MDSLKIYPPSETFSQSAHIQSEAQAERFRETALAQPEAFWAELSRALVFEKPFTQVLNWKMPKAEWFGGGQINVSKNCLDRHAQAKPNRPAILWEGEPQEGGGPEIRKLNYTELLELTCQISNTLLSLGVKKGDRVALYMPMVPETVATMQACARIGAVHTVIFGGFSAQSIADRVKDCGAKVIVTADGTFRKGKFLELKKNVDEALKIYSSGVEKVLVFERRPGHLKDFSALDLRWKDSVLKAKKTCAAVALDTEDPLFILYTSGTTGKPKGLYHTQAGYLLGAHWSSRWLFDLKDEDLFFCTADCGWITGHTYLAYGPLSNGAQIFIYEGNTLFPTASRLWEMIDRHKISILYTAPTAIRMLMRLGDDYVKKSSRSSLRLLGSVGEPINPEAWRWYFDVVGDKRCPVVDTWWQTETGSTMISGFPGATPQKPGAAGFAMPGVAADIVDPKTGRSQLPGEKGALVIRAPWPSMARGIWGDPERFEKTYWNSQPSLKGVYLTGDLALQDEDGYFWIEGRMDDVLNVSGHRIGSAEVESALVGHDHICEAAAVGIPDPIKGQSIVTFISLSDEAALKIKNKELSLKDLKAEASQLVATSIGSHARPDQIRVAAALPKTRSGKIMRRLLREVASSGKITGDTSTLEDFSVEASLASDEES